MYCIVNNVFLTAHKHVGHDCQVWGDFALDIAAFTSDFVQCLALISSPVTDNLLLLSDKMSNVTSILSDTKQ